MNENMNHELAQDTGISHPGKQITGYANYFQMESDRESQKYMESTTKVAEENFLIYVPIGGNH